MGGPNASPLDLFPQGGAPGAGGGAAGLSPALEFLRNNPRFQELRAMVQANPQLLQPMLSELGKQNPELLALIQAHQGEFLHLINEPVEGDMLSQLEAAAAAAGGALPPGTRAIQVTAEEQEAIARLESMGFERDLVIEAFFACDKNEELAANYLLEHGTEFDD
eukprot:TRINITY_DN21433_c0_g1_i1.p1 TRINITY_DN21433_c0_g1~~TRINITY_DN21433_c0_g1_i1.p1  ORF type:complete len:192 (+),score=7.14 TRINITY_DN21433_c0_g1_i1:87-578(+)